MHIDRLDLGQSAANNDFDRAISKNFQRLMDQLVELFNGGLNFTDNFECTIASVTIALTDTEIPHTLKRVPVGYIVMGRDQAGIVYDGAIAWTTENIYVRSSVASLKIKIMVF